jgi:2-oxoglutarate ferredoxin oxidoreductase subunit alpha
MNFYVLKYTGRPMTTTEIYDSVKNILEGKAAERQALTYGP